MGTEQTTASKVTAVLESLAPVGVNVTPESRLAEDLNFDSLDCVEATMAMEGEFDIEVSDSEAEACKTVADWIALVEKAQAAKGTE